MLFMTGIETPKNDNQAWGALVPVFEEYGYGCVAASDNEADIIEAAKASILDMLQEMHDDGQLLTNLNTGYKDYSVSFPEFDRWVAIEVDDKLIEGKKERFNVSWDKRFLQRVDDHLKTSGKYSDRSVFLAVAVDEKIRQSDSLQ